MYVYWFLENLGFVSLRDKGKKEKGEKGQDNSRKRIL
jgi:hypothetical protein